VHQFGSTYKIMHGILELLYPLRLVDFLVLTSVFTHTLAFGYLLLMWPYEMNHNRNQ